MIISWKKVSALEYVAHWQGKDLQLVWSHVEHRWQAYVNGARVNRRWSSAVAAIDAIEDTLSKILRAMGASVQAQQRPRSMERIVRRAQV